MPHAPPEDWRVKGSSCFSPMGTCCLSFWCPCVVFGRAHHRLRGEDMATFSKCNGPCWGFGLLSYVGCQWILQMMQRGEIRSHYNLKGGCCSDCLCACYCCLCDLAQQDKECKARNQENMHLIKTQPAVPTGMVYNEKPALEHPPQQHHQHQSPPPQQQYPHSPQNNGMYYNDGNNNNNNNNSNAGPGYPAQTHPNGMPHY